MVGMVPDMFQVPINAPTENRIKMAPEMVAMPLRPDSETSSQLWPFFRMTIAVIMVLRMMATCRGPLTASRPNRATEDPTSKINVTIGSRASR
ncbi:hypothetical protein D3C80_1543350 [compost metagenome]